MTGQHTPYYAKNGVVWKAPVETKEANGSTTITLSFPVCAMHEAVGDDAAETVAEMLCKAENAPDLLAQRDALQADLKRIASMTIGGPYLSAKDGMAAALAGLDRCRDIARAALATLEDGE